MRTEFISGLAIRALGMSASIAPAQKAVEDMGRPLLACAESAVPLRSRLPKAGRR
ncbi:MAG: hypothetical protein HY716_09035 [Planctomycetes bacterium]|nr:hypothetical protein [Planctomycetota bacterium]